jgi:hypothetical protein
MGGLATWSYASYSQWAGLLAGIVPIASDTNTHGLAGAEAMAANNLPIFATHNKDDPTLPCSADIYNVNLVNSVTPPINPTAQFRMFYLGGHDAWDSTYNPNSIFYQGLNIYQWMLLYTRDPGGNTPPPPAPPTITSFTPTSGGLGLSVSISGTGFTGTNAVSFGGVAASAFTIQSDNLIIAIVNSGASGSVQVTGPGGTGTLAGFRFIEIPVINSFTPTSGPAGATVTIRGSGFTGVSSVTFGGVAASTFTVESDSVIAAIVNTGASGVVEVTSPGGTATLAGFQFFAAPVINTFSPTSGGLGITVLISGTGFTGANSVSFGGVAASAFTIQSDNLIIANVNTGASGSVQVTGPGGTATLAGFRFIEIPAINSFTPTSGPIGTTVTISGSGFTGVASVTFGGVAAAQFAVVSDSVISAIVNYGASGDVQVTSPGGTATLAGFQFLAAPAINSFTPTSGGLGMTVTISGSGFSSASLVTFGGVGASAFTIVSDSVISAIVDTGASGSVVVTSPYGTATLAGFSFNVPPPPVVPLGFVSFTAVQIGSLKTEVQLSWSDSSEEDNRYFVVERSADSIQFSAIDTISAIPGLLTGDPYSDLDPSPLPGPDYYRVLQVHLDGTASVSPVRKVIAGQGSGVTPTGPEAPGLWLSPNPATATLYVTIGGSVSESLELRLVDVSGNILREWLFQKTAHNWIQQVDIGDLVAGTYFIQAIGGNWHSAQAFIKR